MWENQKVLRIINGNTFEVKSGDNKHTRVRLANVFPDGQNENEAKAALKRMILGKNVRLKTVSESRDGGKVAQVKTPDGVLVNHEMRLELSHV